MTQIRLEYRAQVGFVQDSCPGSGQVPTILVLMVRAPTQPYKFTPSAKAASIEYVRKYGRRVPGMAGAAGVGCERIRLALREEEAYRDAVDIAHGDFLKTLLEAAIQRGVKGWKEVHLAKDGSTYEVEKFSDSLLQTLLKGMAPDEFANRVKVESTSMVVQAGIGLNQFSLENQQKLLEIFESEAIRRGTTPEGATSLPAVAGLLAPPPGAETGEVPGDGDVAPDADPGED